MVFGAQIHSSYYRRLLLFATVMYVDKTNLIHWSCQPFCSLVELIVASHTKTYAWGGLAVAKGAALKPDKCYVYFLAYWYNRGHAKLQTVWALPESIAPITLLSGNIALLHLWFPLPDGTTAPKPALRNDDASLMLGIYFSPTSNGRTHTRKMAQKRFIWANQMKSQPLPPSLAWQRFYPSNTTRHAMGSCFCHPVPPQTFRTIPKGLLQMPPVLEVVKVRMRTFSSLVAEYLIGGFMRQ
jgi:hypothetical protein